MSAEFDNFAPSITFDGLDYNINLPTGAGNVNILRQGAKIGVVSTADDDSGFATHDDVATAVGVETSRAEGAEGDLTDYVDDETERAEGVEGTLATKAGTPVLRHFAFAFDTASIGTGAALYVPTVGDYLLDGWIIADTTWNGTTPLADFGLFKSDDGGPFQGFFAAIKAASVTATPFQDMTAVAMVNALGLSMCAGTNNDFAALSAYILTSQFVPAQFASTAPVCVCVTSDGVPGSTADSTSGTGHLFLLTATPA